MYLVNIHKGITIEIRKSGFRHMLYARNSGYVKIKAVIALKQMLENATFCNFKDADHDDTINVLGYFNFKCRAIIENKSHLFRIVVRLTKEGKFYYDHAVKVSNKKEAAH